MQKAVIIGVGPDRGLGAQLCKRFAKEGLHVVAAGRTSASLDAVVADTQRSGRRLAFADTIRSEARTSSFRSVIDRHASGLYVRRSGPVAWRSS
jgi:NAD(P)-dependent dehydrogenase (short-subunit alcohol dehydrogenase family)